MLLKETYSNTIATDRSDGNLAINRWTTRNIFRFTSSQYGYDRCMFKIPLVELANGIVIDRANGLPHENTLANYPYPEEIIMTSQKTEKNFIHFINVQYTDSHYGHYNGKNYNLMIVKDRTRYGVINSKESAFEDYTSIYTNDIITELAYIDSEYMYLPVPSSEYGDELLDTLWDCRVIWRADPPDRTVSVTLSLEKNNSCWTETTVGTSDRYWYSICYGNDRFVAIPSNSNIAAYSLDGITWTTVELSVTTNKSWRGLCYGNGKFVAFAKGDTICIYSTDGISWSYSSISNTAREWINCCYGNGKFVAIANSSTIFAYSTDGTWWTEVTAGNSDPYWQSVCYGNGKFIAINSDSTSYVYSTDGITWKEETLYTNIRALRSICCGDARFVAVGNTNYYEYYDEV